MEWRHTSSPVKIKFKQTKNHVHSLLEEKRSFVWRLFAQKLCNQLRDLLRNFEERRAIQNKRGVLTCDIILLIHHNARPHTAAATQQLFLTFKREQFDHPSYSPDLAPSDYHFLNIWNFPWWPAISWGRRGQSSGWHVAQIKGGGPLWRRYTTSELTIWKVQCTFKTMKTIAILIIREYVAK